MQLKLITLELNNKMKKQFQLSNGNIFYITDGELESTDSDKSGFFVNDTRYLHKFIIKINDKHLNNLSITEANNDELTLVKLNETDSTLKKKSLTVIQEIVLTNTLVHKLKILNNTKKEIKFKLNVEAIVDFVDIFEIKLRKSYRNTHVKKIRQISFEHNEDYLYFSYEKEGFKRGTLIKFSEKITFVDNNNIYFNITLQTKEEKDLTCIITPCDNNLDIIKYNNKKLEDDILKVNSISNVINTNTPRLETDWYELDNLYLQSIKDLKSLTLNDYQLNSDFEGLVVAGLPWYMTIFGRDSLITCLQYLLFDNELSKKTLLLLSKYQGTKIDNESEEEPGKILHEMRFGEFAYFNEWVKFPYYGTNDATALYLILFGELFQIINDTTIFTTLKPNILAALKWIEEYGDMDKDGYVEYQKKTEKGIRNQNWRDSYNSMIFNDGQLARSPIASSDVQAYVYKAKLGIADIALKVWNDESLANKLKSEANDLKVKFNKDFWIEDKRYFAIGLDHKKKQIDSLTSSIGQLLWSGIVDKQKMPYIAEHLNSSRLYSGFGIRTLDAHNPNFNPLGYHQGTIWPHDNSLIFEGLMKNGFKKEATKMIENMINNSKYFDYRLPETFSGYSKTTNKFPIEYPVSSSPQAWAAGSCLLFLKSMLNISINKEQQTLKFNPSFPEYVDYIRLVKIKAWDKVFELKLYKNQTEVNIIE